MATSGTTDFNLSIDEIVEEAFNRNGIRPNSGNDMRRARRNLNFYFLNGEIEVFIYGK
jgi:hypothetical protein